MKLQEDYCSYEVAKLLKEKGFDEPCQAYWRDFENGDRVNTTFAPNENHNEAKGFTSMPTHQMAMKWLREVHKLHIEIDVYEGIKYAWSLSHADSGEYVIDPLKLRDKGYPTYEEAVEAALKYCLIKLI